MTQEDKELLLRDLCARLPYGVVMKNQEIGNDFELDGRTSMTLTQSIIYSIIKYRAVPYLRSIDSITEEEKKDFENKFEGFFQIFNGGIISDSRKWDKNESVFVGEESCSKLLDWLNERHIDYRGLIGRGLAIKVTDENNPYKK